MSRLTIPSLDDSPAASKPILDAIHKQLGVVPNLFRLIGTSPAALAGFASNNGALGKTLDVKTRSGLHWRSPRSTAVTTASRRTPTSL